MYVKVIACKFRKFRKANNYVVKLNRENLLYFLNTVIAEDHQKNRLLTSFFYYNMSFPNTKLQHSKFTETIFF